MLIGIMSGPAFRHAMSDIEYISTHAPIEFLRELETIKEKLIRIGLLYIYFVEKGETHHANASREILVYLCHYYSSKSKPDTATMTQVKFSYRGYIGSPRYINLETFTTDVTHMFDWNLTVSINRLMKDDIDVGESEGDAIEKALANGTGDSVMGGDRSGMGRQKIISEIKSKIPPIVIEYMGDHQQADPTTEQEALPHSSFDIDSNATALVYDGVVYTRIPLMLMPMRCTL